MSALAAIVSRGADPAARSKVGAMLTRMRAFGDRAQFSSSQPGHGEEGASATLGATSFEWEGTLGASPALVATRGPLRIVTDATLYHRADLRRALGFADSSSPLDASDAALILAVYERWGIDGLSRLEGDFAFLLWDGERQRLVAARDFAGHRTLHFARVADRLLVATTVVAILSDTAVPRELDLAAVATVAAGLWGHSGRTAYRAIQELPAGHALVWEPDSDPSATPFWRPPDSILHRRQPLDAAAEELRELLVSAVRERLAPSGPTGLSLSGGWDSTAVGGAAMVALRDDPSRHLQPVSISYPEGDPGREDETINQVLTHWGIGTEWIDVDTIPMFPHAENLGAKRELPFAHAYEEWNRRLSRGARERGARVMLDGVGGDQLFQVSGIFLSDLFGRGRWIELTRQ